jgi:uracil-DNA glycosylase
VAPVVRGHWHFGGTLFWEVSMAGEIRPPEAAHDCSLCPRLAAFVGAQREVEPSWHNGPVRSFGDADGRLLVVGLAPGLKGANRTGRPFTGDYAGDLLYATLAEYGFSRGTFAAHPDDGLELVDCLVTNAVRCVPPENKPTPAEITTCRGYLTARIAAMPKLTSIVVLGRIAHDSCLTALGARKSRFPFGHGAVHEIERENSASLRIFDSYHCSRYNTNTRVLTPEMFHAVFAAVREHLDAA